mmetsp:Transcript_18367/g.34680  ORF Transcript_18367/g.34680 Transcript_18367/m.34680 type:complete len:212 (-) Transcript_18367:1168-1803(-)
MAGFSLEKSHDSATTETTTNSTSTNDRTPFKMSPDATETSLIPVKTTSVCRSTSAGCLRAKKGPIRTLSWVQKLGRTQRWWVDRKEIIIDQKHITIGKVAKVYKAEWRNLEIAVKALKTHKKDKRSMELLTEEIHLWSTIRHPNVVMFLGASFRSDMVKNELFNPLPLRCDRFFCGSLYAVPTTYLIVFIHNNRDCFFFWKTCPAEPWRIG